MKPRTLGTLVVAAALALLGTPAVLAQAEDEAVLDDYASGDYGRVRVAENGATVLRTDVEDGRNDLLGLNSPVFPGDRVRTGRDQRLEVELAGGSLVRIDRDAEVTFQALPDPYAEHADNIVLALDYGSMQVAPRLSSKEEFRIDTPAASVYLVGDGDFRIDVDSDGTTFVRSRRGVAEVVGDDGSVLVRAGLETEVFPGRDPDQPRRFNVYAADTFDGWTGERDRIARQWRGEDDDLDLETDDLPYTVRPYYRELSSYGRWAWVPTYGYVWYPGSVAAGWRPYHDGYWAHSPRGYFWVSHEPWGWAPYHYGRWVHVNRYGWAWCPGRIFAGAWVSWSWGSAHVGWAPLDYWNRPVHYRTVIYDYYDPLCWSFVRYDHLVVRDYRRHYIPADRIGVELRRHAVVTRPPRVAPRALVRDAALRDRTWRSLQDDRVARIAPVRRDATPTRRFVDAEDRAVKRGDVRRAAVRRPEATAPRAGAPRVEGTTRGQERIERPGRGNERPTARPAPGRATGSTERPAARPRRITSSEEPAARPRPRVEQNDDARGRERAPAARPAERPRPRTEQSDDARGRERAPAARPAERPRPSDSRGRTEARPRQLTSSDERSAADRRRDLYRGARRPVEPQRPAADRDRGGDRDRAPSARPAERPRPQERAQPRPERAQPRAEPRPQPRPERAQPRAEPRPQPRPERAQPRAEPRPQPRPERAQPRPQPKPERAQPKRDDNGGRSGGGGSKAKSDDGGRGRGKGR